MRASAFVQVPLSFGSIVLVPASYTRWDAQQRRAVMAHEAAHIDGGDFHLLIVSAVNRAIFWFSPAAWWLHHRLLTLAEARSDAVAIEQIDDRLRYAEILLAFGAQAGRRRMGLAIAAPYTIRRRIERIVAQTVPPKRLGWKTRLALVACILPLVGIAACAVAQAPANGRAVPIATTASLARMLAGENAGAVAQAPSSEQVASAVVRPTYDAARVARLLDDQRKPRKEIPIDVRILDNYVGYYRLTTSAVLTVTRESDHLLVRITGEYDWPVYPERPDKFFYKVMAAQISFISDVRGQVTGLVLHQHGVETPAQRIDRRQAQEIEASLQKRIKDPTPLPGSAAALQPQIDGLAQGKPDFDDMTEEFAGIITQRNPNMPRHLRDLGALQSIAFLGVGTEGQDVYEVKFDNGMLIGRILMGSDGKVADLHLDWGP